MSIYQTAADRIARNFYKSLFMRQAKAVLQTPPAQPGPLALTTLSMVHTRDVLPYLVAFKSFHRQVPAEHAVVVCDPSITASDKQTLRRHIPYLELRDAAEFTHAAIPRGGTWERLYAISEYSTRRYTIQLDADTVTTGPLAEVEQGIAANRAFVIGEVRDQRVDPLSVYGDIARAQTSTHVQTLSEATLDRLDLAPGTRYVRGCSGFTGFATNSDMRERMIDFSTRMQARLGERWRDWGTEQVTSNFLVANQPQARVLPFPKYASSHRTDADSVFFHFIGSVRFRNRQYELLTRGVINQLDKG